MNYDSLVTAVTDHQFASTTYATYAGEKLNEAQEYVAAQVDFRGLFDVESFSTTAGTSSYALPSDFLRLYSLEDTDNLTSLALLQVPDFDLLDSAPRGRPYIYAIDRSNVKVYPTPDAAYPLQLRHYRLPATMTTGTSPEIPEPYHHLLVSYALSKCFEREHQLDLAQYHWGVFERDLGKARGEVQHDSNDVSQADQVPGMWNTSEVWPRVQIP